MIPSRGVNEMGQALARLSSSSARHVLMKLELGSVQAYLFELELVSRVKPKARARLHSTRAILRTTSDELKTRLELASISLKRDKAWLANVITIIIILYIN
ncbi:hypothetical protein Hanom_Chr04g00290011 [Helianthus anomalus]